MSPSDIEAPRCYRCGQALAAAADAVAIGGAHIHDVMNPAGYRYQLRCFARAPGCVSAGESSSEASWFEGCTWQRAFCTGCSQHVGWRFRSRIHDFFALIPAPAPEASA